APCPSDDGAAETGNPHLEPLEVADRGDLLLEPSRHLRGYRHARARHEVEGAKGLLPEPEPVALVAPGGHTLAVHAERYGSEPRERRFLRCPCPATGHERLDSAPGDPIEAGVRIHDLSAWEDLDLETPSARLLDHLRQAQGRAVQDVQRRGVGGGHAPADPR